VNIIITGIDGYLGWPTALKLSKAFPDARIIGIDNLGRRNWVSECGAVSAVPIASMEDRLAKAHELGFTNISYIQNDLVDVDFVYGVLRIFRPEIVLHLAAQPSAPYAHIDIHHANFTQNNNNQATRNLLWGIQHLGLHDTHFIETTTTGVYGSPDFPIPEGYLEIDRKGGQDTIPYPGMAGSWYHMSKSNDVNNLYLAAKEFNYPITDVRTAIIYGTRTQETEQDETLATRFDFDFYFGVVGNRFCAMALAGSPIIIYGKGMQRKPMISLEDAAASLVGVAKKGGAAKKLTIYNQMTELVPIAELGKAVKDATKERLNIDVELKHIPNPRIEKEDHAMTMENSAFMKILGKPGYTIETGISETMETIGKHRDMVLAHKDRFMS